MHKELPAILVTLGALSVACGVALLSLPLGLVTLGVFVMLAGIIILRGDGDAS